MRVVRRKRKGSVLIAPAIQATSQPANQAGRLFPSLASPPLVISAGEREDPDLTLLTHRLIKWYDEMMNKETINHQSSTMVRRDREVETSIKGGDVGVHGCTSSALASGGVETAGVNVCVCYVCSCVSVVDEQRGYCRLVDTSTVSAQRRG